MSLRHCKFWQQDDDLAETKSEARNLGGEQSTTEKGTRSCPLNSTITREVKKA